MSARSMPSYLKRNVQKVASLMRCFWQKAATDVQA